MATYQRVVISPHVDDAFLSLGGMLSKNSHGHQKVVNIFCVSDFAPRGSCPKGDVDCVTALRRKEELANCRLVGAEVDFLPFRDAKLRNYKRLIHDLPRYDEESDMIREVKEKIRVAAADAKTVFLPLAIGRHVDHLIVNRIGLELAVESQIPGDLFFYEDMPYSARKPRRYSLIDLSKDRAKLEPTLVSFPWRRKWSLCTGYQSQFSNRAYRRILRYAKGVKVLGTFYERIWQVRDLTYMKGLLGSQI